MSVPVKQVKLSAQCFVQWMLRSNFKTSDLLLANQVPEIFREPYIYTGYRPGNRSWKYYVHSILHLHNETLNIWTHFLGFFVLLFYLVHMLKDYDVTNNRIAWTVIAFGLSCILSMVISTVAHLLHSKSPWHHHAFFMLDYSAIAIYGFGIGLGSLYVCSDHGFRDSFQHWYLPANVLVSWLVFFMLCTSRVKLARHVEKRKQLIIISTAIQGIFLCAPMVPRYTSCMLSPECSIMSLNHLTLVVFLDTLSAIAFAALLPERWIPGRCDIVGHSHQIFHVLAVFSMIAKLSAMTIDIDILNILPHIFPSLTTLFVSLGFVLLLHICTFFYFLQCVKCESKSKRNGKMK